MADRENKSSQKIEKNAIRLNRQIFSLTKHAIHLGCFLAKFQKPSWLAEIIKNHLRLNVNSWFLP